MQGIVRGRAPRRTRRGVGLGAGVLTLAATALLAGAAAADGATQRYPGAAPCDGTLQRCIDKSAPRTRILIAKNVKEDLEISTSVTLQPAPGADPAIGSNSAQWELEVRTRGSQTLKAKLRRLEFRNVEIDVNLTGGSGHRILLQGSSIDNPLGDSNGVSGIDVDAERSGRIRLRGNEIATKGDAIDVTAAPEVGPLEMEIANNRITTSDNPAGVDPNDSHGGMNLEIGGTARAEVDVYSNLVYGVAGCNCGGASSVEIEGNAADGIVNFIGNTVDDSQYSSEGLDVNDEDPGSLTLNLFNNLVSNASDDVIELPDDDPGLTILHDHNDFYDPGDPPDFGDYPPGPHTDQEDPLYVDAAGADYRLQSVSPQAAQGIVCPPGGQSAMDLAGNDRVERLPGMGAFVTPGAFGFAPGPPEGLFLLGTDEAETLDGGGGSDVICAYGGDDTANGKGGDDVIAGGDGADVITDGSGDDYLYGEAGQDDITAGAGDDYLSGGDDFDELEAHDGIDGNDYLDGGGGVDSCNPDPGDLFTNC
jgi:hypothetical protein